MNRSQSFPIVPGTVPVQSFPVPPLKGNGNGNVPAGQTNEQLPERKNGAVEEAVIDEVLDLLAAAIWADFKGRNLSHGQDPEGNRP